MDQQVSEQQNCKCAYVDDEGQHGQSHSKQNFSCF